MEVRYEEVYSAVAFASINSFTKHKYCIFAATYEKKQRCTKYPNISVNNMEILIASRAIPAIALATVASVAVAVPDKATVHSAEVVVASVAARW